MANSIFVKLHVALSLLEEGLSTIFRFFRHSNSEMSMWLSRWNGDQETPVVSSEESDIQVPMNMSSLANWQLISSENVTANDYQLIVQNNTIYSSVMVTNSQSASLESKWTNLHLVQRLIGSDQDSVESVGETGSGLSSFWFDDAKMMRLLEVSLDKILDNQERYFSIIFGSTHESGASEDILFGVYGTAAVGDIQNDTILIEWSNSSITSNSANFESIVSDKHNFVYYIYNDGGSSFIKSPNSHAFAAGNSGAKIAIIGVGRKVSNTVKLRGLYITGGLYVYDSQSGSLDNQITFRLTKLDDDNLEYYNSQMI